MMRSHRPGFTLIEVLLVVVLGTIIMGAAVQSLVSQERTHRTTGEMIRGQDALRTALGILEGELREVTSMAPALAGVTDLMVATRDSLQVRTQRKIGFVCSVHPSDKRLHVWSPDTRNQFRGPPGEGLPGDLLVVFADGQPNTSTDDRWYAGQVRTVGSSTATCPFLPTDRQSDPKQRIDLDALGGGDFGEMAASGINPGAPIRSFEQVTYGLFQFGGEWGLGLRRAGQTGAPDPLVIGLAGPGEGLVFTYLDQFGNDITADPVPTQTVAGVRVTAKTLPRPGSGATAVELTTNIYFRNN
jgi:prepilin-type N-terminal cleavage/methylation domain-containing protein